MVAVIGLDPGIAFGFSAYDGKVRESGVIRLQLGKEKDPIGQVASRLAVQVTRLAEAHDASAFAFESNAGLHQASSRNMRAHGGYEAVCGLIAWGLEVPFRRWTPGDLKAWVADQLTADETRRCREARASAASFPKKSKERNKLEPKAKKMPSVLLANRIKGGQTIDDNEAEAICLARATYESMVF